MHHHHSIDCMCRTSLSQHHRTMIACSIPTHSFARHSSSTLPISETCFPPHSMQYVFYTTLTASDTTIIATNVSLSASHSTDSMLSPQVWSSAPRDGNRGTHRIPGSPLLTPVRCKLVRCTLARCVRPQGKDRCIHRYKLLESIECREKRNKVLRIRWEGRCNANCFLVFGT